MLRFHHWRRNGLVWAIISSTKTVILSHHQCKNCRESCPVLPFVVRRSALKYLIGARALGDIFALPNCCAQFLILLICAVFGEERVWEILSIWRYLFHCDL